MSINGCQKGKRVEREVANWLKENGIASARRTEQYSGSPEGLSDVIADVELPSWHIESKGTKKAKLSKSTIKKWISQVERDCSPGKIPVIIHVANGKEKVAIIPTETYFKLKNIMPISFQLQAYFEESITPSLIFENYKEQDKIFSAISKVMSSLINLLALVYKVSDEPYTLCVFIEGLTWLEMAKNYEIKTKPASDITSNILLSTA